MRQPKFSFSIISFQEPEPAGYFVSISTYSYKGTTSSSLVISKKVIDELDWENKMIEFFSDASNNALAFRILEGNIKKEDFDKTRTRVLKRQKTGQVQVGITKFMDVARIPLRNYRVQLKQYEDKFYGTLFYFAPEIDPKQKVEETEDNED